MDVNRVRSSIKTLGSDMTLLIMLIQDVRDLMASSKRVRADTETLRKRITELGNNVLVKMATTTRDSAFVNGLFRKWVSVKMKLATSLVKYLKFAFERPRRCQKCY